MYFTAIRKKLYHLYNSLHLIRHFHIRYSMPSTLPFCLVIIPLSQMRKLKCHLPWGHKQDLGMRPQYSHSGSIFSPLHNHTEARTWAAWSAHGEQSY